MKTFFSVVAVAAMLSPTVIPALYPAPTDPLSLFKWKLTLIVGSIIGVLSFGLHLYFQRREERAREAKQEERNMELVRAVGAEFDRKLALIRPAIHVTEPSPAPPSIAELGMAAEDPRIYVDIKEVTESMFRRTPFVLSNRGKEVAHKVRMEPFKLDRKTVRVPIVEAIQAGESRDALPTIDRADGPMTEHDLFHWLLKDWNASGEGLIDEWPIQIVVVYSDFSMKRHFTATMKLVFHPIRYLLETGHEWPPHDTVLWEFRDIEFKRIS